MELGVARRVGVVDVELLEEEGEVVDVEERVEIVRVGVVDMLGRLVMWWLVGCRCASTKSICRLVECGVIRTDSLLVL